MNYTMTREKNIIFFQAENKVKPYKFDVNTGVFYGLSGKPIATCPAGFGDWLHEHRRDDNVIFTLNGIRCNPRSYGYSSYITPPMSSFVCDREYFQIADRLNSIGYMLCDDEYGNVILREISENFKNFAKYIRENPNGNWKDCKASFLKNQWVTKYKLDTDEHITSHMIDIMWANKKEYPEEYTSHVAYYISRSLYDLYEIAPQSVCYSNSNYNVANMFSHIKKYFTFCEQVGVKPQKEEFCRSFINLRRAYVMNKQKLDAEALIAQYAKHPALAYENDTFKVIIPATREDFLNEANAQRNCVYSYYLPKVVKGETNVVFIRRKDNIGKSWVTCEVNNRGNIVQFLGFSNSIPNDLDTIDFKKAYTDHLRRNWR